MLYKKYHRNYVRQFKKGAVVEINEVFGIGNGSMNYYEVTKDPFIGIGSGEVFISARRVDKQCSYLGLCLVRFDGVLRSSNIKCLKSNYYEDKSPI